MGFDFDTAQGTVGDFQPSQGLAVEGAATPAMAEFQPASGGIGQQIIIALSDMPASFTLNDITLNSVSLGAQSKTNDSEVRGSVTPGNSTGLLVVTYNTSETVDSSELEPSSFTVV